MAKPAFGKLVRIAFARQNLLQGTPRGQSCHASAIQRNWPDAVGQETSVGYLHGRERVG